MVAKRYTDFQTRGHAHPILTIQQHWQPMRYREVKDLSTLRYARVLSVGFRYAGDGFFVSPSNVSQGLYPLLNLRRQPEQAFRPCSHRRQRREPGESLDVH